MTEREYIKSPQCRKHIKCELYENYNIKKLDKSKQEYIEDHKNIYEMANRPIFERIVNSITEEEICNMLIIKI